MANPICDRLLFRPDTDIVEPLVASWSPPETALVKKRSAFLKPIILYLQDDPNRQPEEIRFYTPSSDSDDDPNDQSRLDTISLPCCVSFEDDFRGFLRDLVSPEAISNTIGHLAPFCKCAWMCKCPPEVFQTPATILNHRRKVIASSSTSSSRTTRVTTPPSAPPRPWDLSRECGCGDDTCTCSIELVQICLWLGWEHEFRKYLKRAIWTGYAGVDIRTPIQQLRNLWEIRTETAQMLRTDLEQYLKDHEDEYKGAIKNKQTRTQIKEYLATRESSPSAVGLAFDRYLPRSGSADAADTADTTSSQTVRPNHNRRVSVHTSGDTSLSSRGSGNAGQGQRQDQDQAKGAFDFGWSDSLWHRMEKSQMSSQDRYDTFVNGVFDHLTRTIDARQDALANSIWAWRQREMRNWRWVLGIQ
ncbi:hypothetical protein QBC36DRAFT_323933 [Triangularia setosa]|uniref:Uncharacterized protein n=1 Tax=Triangularia setosa TaxID=2587417 RepID=A0AAN7A828_9PEZI|nr:hypothetical protein QBC36DRAFT_323933 [Podospora setosa]